MLAAHFGRVHNERLRRWLPIATTLSETEPGVWALRPLTPLLVDAAEGAVMLDWGHANVRSS